MSSYMWNDNRVTKAKDEGRPKNVKDKSKDNSSHQSQYLIQSIKIIHNIKNYSRSKYYFFYFVKIMHLYT